jgi:hypothetical protein
VLHVVHIFLDICEQHDLVFHNTNKDYLYVNVSPTLWRAWILYYQSTWGSLLAKLPKVGLTLEGKNSFVLSMFIRDAFLVDIQKTCCHTEQLVQWLDLMLKGMVVWRTNPSHHLVTQIKINLWMLFHPMKYCKPIV